tara:strand:- start:281 stop:439 length:159 start_codon:yes stop_codon:yes gene_type:complete
MSGGNMEDERIKFVWLQTSGTGRSDVTSTPNYRISAEEYFNKITRNNQGNVK